jgi:hypothetical protein
MTTSEEVNLESLDDSHATLSAVHREDNSLLRQLGYKSEFKREFSVRVQPNTRHAWKHQHAYCSLSRQYRSLLLSWPSRVV